MGWDLQYLDEFMIDDTKLILLFMMIFTIAYHYLERPSAERKTDVGISDWV